MAPLRAQAAQPRRRESSGSSGRSTPVVAVAPDLEDQRLFVIEPAVAGNGLAIRGFASVLRRSGTALACSCS